MEPFKKYVPDMVFGSIDGIITIFAIVAGVYGAGVSAGLLLVLGFANLFAKAFSMVVSNHLALQTLPPEAWAARSRRVSGFVTLSSFIMFGTLPMLPFVYAHYAGLSVGAGIYFIAFCVSVVAFYALGLLRGVVTQTLPVQSANATLFIGLTASFIAFVAGHVLAQLVS